MMLTDAAIAKFRSIGKNLRGRTAIYRQGSRSTNYKTGEITSTWSDTTITVLASMKESGESETMTFRVLASELPTTPPAKTDRIQWRSQEWIIQGYEIDQSDACYDIHCVRA